MMTIFLLGDMLDRAVLAHFVFARVGGRRSLDQSTRSKALKRLHFTRDSHTGLSGEEGTVKSSYLALK